MTWDGIRGTFQWMLVLLLVTMVSAGAAGLHFWSQKDVIIHNVVSEKLNQFFSGADVSFQAVSFIDGSELVISNLQISVPNSPQPLAQVPRVRIQLDGALLLNNRRMLIKQVEVESPKVFVTRSSQGVWNWEQLELPAPAQNYSPTFVVKNGLVQIGLQSYRSGPLHTVVCRELEFNCIPEAQKRYQISGNANADSLGPVQLSGLFDSQSGEWNIAGSAGGIRIDEPLLERTGLFVPQVGQQLAKLYESPQYLARQQDRSSQSNIRSASNTNSGLPVSMNPSKAPNEVESFIRADLQLKFSAGQKKNGPLEYKLDADVKHGHLSDLFLPIPLYDVQAEIELTPNQIKIDNFRASNNKSSLFIDGVARKRPEGWGKNFVVEATHLQIDERIQSVLSGELLKIYRLISPSGTFDLDFDLSQEPGQEISGNLRKFTARNCRIVHDLFRYPVEKIDGEITHQGDQYFIIMNGLADKQPIQLNGSFGDGTKNKDSELSLAVKNVPVDEKFLNAFGRKEQEGVKKALQSLGLSGEADVTARFIKNAATENAFKMQLIGNVRESKLNYVGFPYELSNLTGTVTYDGLKKNVWYFTDLKARHGHAHLSGTASYNAEEAQHQLGLEFRAVRIPIDAALEKASLTSAPHMATVWNDFSLGGTVDIDKVNINWSPGGSTAVTLNGIQWKDGTIKPAAFPYQWTDVVGALDWDGQRLNIHSLHGWHDSSYLEINGSDPDWPAFVSVPPTGDVAWALHFGDLKLVQAKFDDELERALPESISSPLKAMDLQGNVNVHLSLDMRGWAADEEMVTARWKLKATMKDNEIITGIPLKGVTGRVDITDGAWDGQKLRMEGAIDLEKASAFDVPFTNVRSAFHLDGEQLVIGAPKFLNPPAQFQTPNPYANKQLRAKVYDGQVGFDAVVLLADRPELTQYKAELNVNDVELATWAADQFQNPQNLKGKVNGLVSMQGMGPSPKAMVGKGWVQIVPAEIMDLPAFAQMFALINFRPVGDTAFNYSYGEFEIKNALLDFSRIELRGDALGLIGKGFVGFANGGQSIINLSFDSRTNNSVRLLRPITQLLGNNWIRVQVMGTVNEPVAVVKPRIGPLDDAFREFTEAIEKGQNLRPPVRVPPIR